jgi:hypothetical protein
MATYESRQRMARRRRQQSWAALPVDPEMEALRRHIRARQRYQLQHPFSGYPGLLLMHCIVAGKQLGSRPPNARRCRRRLKTKFCWNRQAPGPDRCHRLSRARVTG